ncbi:MAG: hypothetical protein OHK93_006526 [Ramalina farinacea]|uniref:Mid2 domain-containing protein n=1 Tax=Ramalina farinacea TaxID=258253 RepID=A0AA43QIR9_9LECA|nr:hypothetical protein [Ramalina farinacea]
MDGAFTSTPLSDTPTASQVTDSSNPSTATVRQGSSSTLISGTDKISSITSSPTAQKTGSITQQVLTTIVFVSGSSTISSVSTSHKTVAAASASSSSTPGLNGNNGGGDSPGLSSNSKKIIGGVVGGVGGAILLGGLAVVAWRIWGKKRSASTDDDDLLDSHPSSAGKEKTSGASDPFRSHLDQAHGPVNTASNF